MKRVSNEDFEEATSSNKKNATKKRQMLVKVVSGGQTGADMAGLFAARQAGLQTGGTAPPNYLTENGCQAQLLSSFGLVALPEKLASVAAGYVRRSIANVINSDATVAFRTRPSSGTDKTIGYCIHKEWKVSSKVITTDDFWEFNAGFKPVLVIVNMGPLAKSALLKFIRSNRIQILNVAGHRDDSSGGWQKSVESFLLDVFSELLKDQD